MTTFGTIKIENLICYSKKIRTKRIFANLGRDEYLSTTTSNQKSSKYDLRFKVVSKTPISNFFWKIYSLLLTFWDVRNDFKYLNETDFNFF